MVEKLMRRQGWISWTLDAALLLTAGCLFLIFGQARMAGAYVLEGPHVLELMAKEMAGPQTLQVQQQVILEDPAVSVQPVVLDETLRFLFPAQFRSDTRHQEAHRILVVNRGQVLTVADGTITSDQEGRFDRYKDLLLYRSRPSLHKALLNHHVDVGVTSLGLWEKRIVFVIGARYPDESVSQLWVDKERFLPLRWLSIRSDAGSSEPAERMEFIYRDWQKRNGTWYPALIETYYNQRRIRLMRVKEVKPDTVFEAELFSISSLMTLYAPRTPPQTEARELPEVDEVERTIEDFRKRLER